MFSDSFGSSTFTAPGFSNLIFLIHFTGWPITAFDCSIVEVKFVSSEVRFSSSVSIKFRISYFTSSICNLEFVNSILNL